MVVRSCYLRYRGQTRIQFQPMIAFLTLSLDQDPILDDIKSKEGEPGVDQSQSPASVWSPIVDDLWIFEVEK
jgi:hypothetical protein